MTKPTLFPPSLRVIAGFSTLSGEESLQALSTWELPNCALATVAENRTVYLLDLDSTASADGFSVIQPSAGPGRWLAVGTTESGSGVYNIKTFGAIGGGNDDTAAIQAAVNAANDAYVATGVVQTVLCSPDRYGIRPSATSSWNMPLSGSTAEVHIGINLKSGVTFECTGAEFVALPPAGAQAAWQYALFGTDLNMTIGDISDVAFIRPKFDFTQVYWTTNHTSLYAFIVVGIDGFELQSPEFVSTGTICGFGGKIMNSANVKTLDEHGDNIRQGHFFNYSTNLESNGVFNGVVEGYDYDEVCYHVWGDITMTNGVSEAQALDISSVQDAFFKVECEAIGNVAIIYQKGSAWPTFAEWVTNFPLNNYAPNPVFCERVKLEARGRNVHSSDLRSIQVNLDRTDNAFGANYWDGKGIIKDIAVDVQLEDCDPILVWECDNLDLDASLREVTTGTSDRTNNGAVILRQARTGATAIAESKLSGRARINVTNSTRTGVRVSGPTDFELECTVDGYNSSDDPLSAAATGVYLEDLFLKNGECTIKNIRVKNGDLTVDPTDFRIINSGSGGIINVRDLGGHRLDTTGATQRMRSGNSGQPILGGEVHLIASIDTVASASIDIPVPYACQLGQARIANLTVTNLAAVPAGGADFTSLSPRRLRAGAVGSIFCPVLSYDAGARTAGTVVDFAIDGTDADGIFVPGDILIIRATRNGAGSVLANLLFRYTFIEYAG